MLLKDSDYRVLIAKESKAKLIFPTYHSFLGSLGLLLNHEKLYQNDDDDSSESECDEKEKKTSGASKEYLEQILK